MGSDTYCAICAGPFCDAIEHAVADDAGDGTGYDLSAFVTVHAAEWLQELQCLGFNPHATDRTKCFISGLGHDDGLGSVIVDPGDDPDFPSHAPAPNGEFYFPAYHVYVEGEPVFPFHPTCYRLLTQVLNYESNGTISELDKDTLYQVFLSLNTLNYAHSLAIDYFELDETKEEQYFWGCRGGEPWVMEPLKIPDLQKFCKILPAAPSIPSSSPVVHAQNNASIDAFSRIPEELVARIMSFLGLSDIVSLRLASRGAASASLSNSIWHAIMFLDMPWLSDIFPLLDSTLDNKELYKKMKEASKGSNPTFIHGLANRRRIWNVSRQIVHHYILKLKSSEAATQGVSEDILRNSKSLSMPFVGSKPKATNSSKLEVWIATSWREATEEPATVEVHWSASCELAGITVQVGTSVRTLGSLSVPDGTRDSFVLKPNDWITGFIVNLSEIDFATYTADQKCAITGLTILLLKGDPVTSGSQTGYKRKIACQAGNIVLCLLAQLTDDVITRLGIREYGHGQLPTAISPYLADNFLWKDPLLPNSLTLGPYSSGQWEAEIQTDLQPFERLIFGESDEELATIVSLAVSSELSYFEVCYGDGKPPRSMGSRKEQDIKHFRIDGAAGERIMYLGINAMALPDGLRIITNFKRQCMFGASREEGAFDPNPDKRIIYGLYGKFVYFLRPTALGLLLGSKPELHLAGCVATELKEGQSSYWEPTCPPSGLKTFGPTYGNSQLMSPSFFPPQPLLQPATWIDFSRPIKKISGLVDTVPNKDIQIEVLREPLCFQHEDGSEIMISASSSPDANQESAAEDDSHHITADLQDGSSIWSPLHGRVTRVSIWSGDKLYGLQFHDEVGSSPVWGSRKGAPTELLVGSKHSDGEISGLKITFFHSPWQLVSIQAMACL